jgi:hypothetical protein
MAMTSALRSHEHPIKHKFEILRTWQGESLPSNERGWVQLTLAGGVLDVCWDAPLWEEPNPRVPPGECADLWQYQAVELFLGVPGVGTYLEFEYGPAGHWLALEFSGYRTLAARRKVDSYAWQCHGTRWTGRAVVSALPLFSRVSVGNAHLVHRCRHGRTHCSASGDPAGVPDFHRGDLFLPLDGGSLGRV